MAEKDIPAVEHETMSTAETPAINNKAIIEEAAERTAFEHSLTVRQAVKYYKWAIFWCLAVRFVFPLLVSSPRFPNGIHVAAGTNKFSCAA